MSQFLMPWAVLGAVVVGLISATTIIVYEHMTQDRRRYVHGKDYEKLRAEIRELKSNLHHLQQQKKHNKRGELRQRANSTTSSVNDDTSEFYDACEDFPFDDEFFDIDKEIETEAFEEAARLLECMGGVQSRNSEVLWRLAKIKHKLATNAQNEDDKLRLIDEGANVCEASLKMNPECGNTHKCYAMLIGMRSIMRSSLKEKISDSLIFKKHLDLAIKVLPSDATLHYLLGRYMLEIASLAWYERAGAAAICSSLPNCTYAEALNEFEDALTYGACWKEVKLGMAKCHIGIGDYTSAVQALREAKSMESSTSSEESTDNEIASLLAKYS